MESLAGQVLTPAGWVAGRLHHSAAIVRIEPWAGAPTDRFILPGFIDLHVHGGGGADTMEGAEAVAQLARFHARHGTTALLPTTVTAPRADLLRAAEGGGSRPARPRRRAYSGAASRGAFHQPGDARRPAAVRHSAGSGLR